MWDKDNLIRELDQIDPEKLRVSPPAPPSPLQIARAELADARSEIEELREILADIAVGARVMLGSPITKAMHPYAAEVLRVATSARTGD